MTTYSQIWPRDLAEHIDKRSQRTTIITQFVLHAVCIRSWTRHYPSMFLFAHTNLPIRPPLSTAVIDRGYLPPTTARLRYLEYFNWPNFPISQLQYYLTTITRPAHDDAFPPLRTQSQPSAFAASQFVAALTITSYYRGYHQVRSQH